MAENTAQQELFQLYPTMRIDQLLSLASIGISVMPSTISNDQVQQCVAQPYEWLTMSYCMSKALMS